MLIETAKLVRGNKIVFCGEVMEISGRITETANGRRVMLRNRRGAGTIAYLSAPKTQVVKAW